MATANNKKLRSTNVGILRNSTRPMPGGNTRRPKRASFSEDQLHDNAAALRGAIDSSMASVNTSQGSISDLDAQSEFHRANRNGASWHEPLWRIARPQLHTGDSQDFVTMANVERGNAMNNALRPNPMEARPAFCKPSNTSKRSINFILNSCIWNTLVLFFTLMLLFGRPIQYFVMESPGIFDAIYCIIMLFLFADIILTSYVDASYFPLRFHPWTQFECGSFLFWFDVIGVGSVFYCFSFVNGLNQTPADVPIPVSEEGSIVTYLKDPTRVNLNLALFSTLIRTMRSARFLNISSVINFANNFSLRLRTFCFAIKNQSRRCIPNKKHAKARMKTAGGVRLSTQQAAPINRGSQYYQKHVDNEAATKIQSAWFQFKNSEAYHKASTERALRQQRAQKHSNLARRLRRRRSSYTNRRGLAQGTKSARSRLRKRSSRYSEIGLAMNYITTKRVALCVLLSIFLPLLFTDQQKHTENPLATATFHNSLVKWKVGAGSLKLGNCSSSSAPSSAPSTLDVTPGQSIADGDFGKAADFYANQTAENYEGLLELSQFLGDDLLYEYSSEKKASKNTTYKLSQDVCVINEGILKDEIIKTIGIFDTTVDSMRIGSATLLFTIFFVIIWFFCLVTFAGPVTTLVVVPIERMIRLLSMLVKDPLGYENSSRFKTFVSEEEYLSAHTFFTKDNLRGMETEFLMNSILRIGSLMKVGFGAAGVQIIKNSLNNKKVAAKQPKASTVSCIFLFCDIRQFTDTSECLQEEIFLFTNKIAEVVHSICHSFGGFANQNKGDAFLVIWKLEESGPNELNALNKEADSALFAVVQICMALNYDDYFLDDISELAKMKMQNKFSDREGNMVQIGFGLHAGKAVEGAIGSERKLDATYLSNEVELAEFLESSTKKYGSSILMSGAFYKLLHVSNRRRCRQVDEAFFAEEQEEDFDIDLFEIGDEENETFMRIYTYDCEFEVLRKQNDNQSDTQSEVMSSGPQSERSFRNSNPNLLRFSERNNRRSFFGGNPSFVRRKKLPFSKRMSILGGLRGPVQEGVPENFSSNFTDDPANSTDELILPTGPVQYHSSLWQSENMKIVRKKFTLRFLYNFELGLNAYLAGEWKEARRHFEFMVQRYDDQPSKVLLKKMESLNNIPQYQFRWTLGKIE